MHRSKREAYDAANTVDEHGQDIVAARDGMEDVTTKREELDNSETALEQARSNVNDLLDEAAQIMGIPSYEEAMENKALAEDADTQAQADLAEANQNAADANTALTDAQTQAEAAQTALTTAENEAEAARAAVEAAMTALDEAPEAEKEQKQAELDAAQQALTEKENALETASLNNEAAQNALTEAEAAKENADKAKADAEQNADQAAQNKAEAEKAAENAQKVQDLKDAIQALEEMESEQQAAKQAADEAAALKAEAENAKAAAENAYNAAEQRVQDAETALTEACNNGDTLAIAEAETELNQAQNDRDKAQAELQEATVQLDGGEGYPGATQIAQDAEQRKAEAENALTDQRTEVSDKTDAVADIAQENTADATAKYTEAQQNHTAAETELGDQIAQTGGIPQDETGSKYVGNTSSPEESSQDDDATIQAGGNVTLTAGGSVGEADESLSLEVDGSVTVTAGNDVNLASPADLNVDTVKTPGSAELTAVGDITAVGGNPAVEAGETTLDAITTGENEADIGGVTPDGFTTQTGSLDMRGNDITVTNTGDVLLGNVEGEEADINASGDIIQKDPDTLVDVDVLDLNAGGDIGTPDQPLEVNTGTLSADGDDVYIHNHSDDLTVDTINGGVVNIVTDGSIQTTPDGMITANDLTVTALDDIGSEDDPLRVTVSGLLDLTSQRGDMWYINFYRNIQSRAPAGKSMITLRDPETNLTVTAAFQKDAILDVLNTEHLAMLLYGNEAEHCDCEDLNQYDEHCAKAGDPGLLNVLRNHADNDADTLLWNLIAEGKTMYDFVVRIYSEHKPLSTSALYFCIDSAGLDSENHDLPEGSHVYVLVSVDGRISFIEAEVRDGKIHVVLPHMNSLNDGYTQFAVISDEIGKALMQEMGR